MLPQKHGQSLPGSAKDETCSRFSRRLKFRLKTKSSQLHVKTCSRRLISEWKDPKKMAAIDLRLSSTCLIGCRGSSALVADSHAMKRRQ